MSVPTQTERVLRALERRGHHGITAADFLYPTVCDQGSPVLRLPSRIDELRRRGHTITSQIERVGSARLARYRLVAPAPAADAPDPRGRAEPLALDLGDTVRHQPASPYDPEVA